MQLFARTENGISYKDNDGYKRMMEGYGIAIRTYVY